MSVTGRLAPGFTVENGHVLIRLTDVSPLPDGAERTSLWIPAADITAPDVLPLRSRLWELPAGQELDFVLRKLSIAAAECIQAGGHRVHLAREMPGATALVFTIRVPLPTATEYLWRFASACRYCRSRSVPWQPPAPVLAAAELDEPGRAGATRANAAHYASQLPLWLPTRQFWSVFQWRDGHLWHTLHFSLPDKLRRTLQRRFRLRQV